MAIEAPAPPMKSSDAKKEATRMEQLFNVAVFFVFLILWIAFAYGLVANQGGLDGVWKSVQGLPLVVQVVVWLLFLPVTIGLWIWESAWPLIVRLPLVLAIGAWNIWMFFPKSLFAR